jgi:hypothetical protein
VAAVVLVVLEVLEVKALVVLVVLLVVLVEVGVVGRLEATPGLVRARISWRLVNPSPSESRPSMAPKLRPAAWRAEPYALSAGTLV